MFSLRINWAKLFSMGEVVCFAATWVVAVWATLQTVDSSQSGQPEHTLAVSEPLPMVASAVE